MAFSERTDNLRLPQWQDDDKPTWLGDMNNAFALIDAECARLQGLINSLQSQINAVQSRVEEID